MGHRCVPVRPDAVHDEGKLDGRGRNSSCPRSVPKLNRLLHLNRRPCFGPLLPVGRTEMETIPLDLLPSSIRGLRVASRTMDAHRSEKDDQEDRNAFRSMHDPDGMLIQT